MSTLDHLTRGRAGWNIVTGYLDSTARGSLDAQTAHDLRYDIADEYMEVVYKLWESSWEDDAVVRDQESGIFAHPEKVHKIHHDGLGIYPEARSRRQRYAAKLFATALEHELVSSCRRCLSHVSWVALF
jgi:alkanesulfonate monooxygenase SsuD/methylene tetrahydromethanopterin reductase-like flavin-dependent oxidoreductase (luciferase family)